MENLIRHVRKAALLGDGGGLTDSQLLECFITRRDEAAFAALVRRHGPLVMGVCRRVLGNHHDAEDAFQATFLVLARRAASLQARALLANWLFGVAYRTALRARAVDARRRTKERQAAERVRPESPAGDSLEEVLPLLDRELARLPERYRVAVVLCDLEGLTRREAARRLNVPEGTLSGRLTAARRLLARRLARYGLAVSGGTLAAALAAPEASAGVTPALAAGTAKAALLVAAGPTVAAGAVPARVAALTEGVMKAMLLSKLKWVSAVVLAFAVSAGAVGLSYRLTAAEPKPARSGAAVASRAGQDELEELRLEIAALRKGLQATRERVTDLEEEVRTLKAQGRPRVGGAPPGMMMGMMGGSGGGFSGGAGFGGRSGGLGIMGGGMGMPGGFPGGMPGSPAGPTGAKASKQPKAADNPLTEAEAALRRLRQHPDDKQATDALERALKQLKERAKPQGADVPGRN